MLKVNPHGGNVKTARLPYGYAVKPLEDGTLIGPDSATYTPDELGVALGTVERAILNGTCLVLTKTKTGKDQWRQNDMSFFKIPETKPVSSTANDVKQFLDSSLDLRPRDLVISDIKWKYLIRSVLRGKNIVMTGEAGTGKTQTAFRVAEALKRPFFNIPLGASQDPRSTLIGNTHYKPDSGTVVALSAFVKAIQTPNAVVLLDELSRAHPDAWNILMSVLDPGQRYLRIDEAPDTPTIPVAEGVTFMATANIGAQYTSTRVMDRALLDRFQIVEMDMLTVEQEIGLLQMIYPDLDPTDAKNIAEIACHTRDQVVSDEPKVSTIISTRMTIEMAGMMVDGFSLREVAEVAVLPFYPNSGGSDSERTYMLQLIQRYESTDFDGQQAPFAADPDDLPF